MTIHIPSLLLRIYLEGNVLYQETFIGEFKGIEVLASKVKALLESAKSNKAVLYDQVEDYLELMDSMVDNEKIRTLLNDSLVSVIYPDLFHILVPLYQKESSLVAVYLSLLSNLCYGNSAIKDKLEEQYKDVATSLGPLIEQTPQKNKYYHLLTSTCNLLSNLLTS